MSYKYMSQIKTKYNPSVIEYSFTYDIFICGTYQLFDEQKSPPIDDQMRDVLARVNNRFGNLLLITKTNELVEEHECVDGGVFDLKLIKYEDINDCIIVAHSNGYVTTYQINSSNKLHLIKRYQTNSSLLTCLINIDNNYSIVGDSQGKLVLINLTNQLLSSVSVTNFSQPVWSLFCYNFNHSYILIVGSDDSLWRVYSMNELSLENFKLIYVNKDSNAGITSFASNYSQNNLLSLIVGSYDEFIRFYDIQFNTNQLAINVNLKHKLHIPDSGIWTIVIRHQFCDTFLVSGMYSGAHLIVNSQVVQTLNNCQELQSNNEEKELIYGLNCDSNMDNILMASFYGQTVYHLRKALIE